MNAERILRTTPSIGREPTLPIIFGAEEAVARVLYTRHGFKYHSPVIEWDSLEDKFREPWLEDARLAINTVMPCITEEIIDVVSKNYGQ